ncbi:hypothetical protein GYMLUDRAFT_909109 [Collybiopsis luxurians FD-317 M1]|nr:hypothetical protein GYMLUDRAFT_909109 [Collybiopsis luxurians FD-317 M1]
MTSSHQGCSPQLLQFVVVAHDATLFPDDDEKYRSVEGKGSPEPGCQLSVLFQISPC